MKINQYITQTYSSIRYKSKRRGDHYPEITKAELTVWLYKSGLREKWIIYIESGYDKDLKPSINRINDYGIYEFSNMELITWRENLIKGVNGKKHHKNSTNKNLRKKVYIWNKQNDLIAIFNSHKEASIYLDCHITSISRAVTKKRKTLKGYILTNTY